MKDNRFKIWITNYLNKTRERHEDPRYVALGFGIGVFVGLTPTLGIHTPLSLGLTLLFRASPIAALVGNWICNPITVVPIYLVDYTTLKLKHLLPPQNTARKYRVAKK